MQQQKRKERERLISWKTDPPSGYQPKQVYARSGDPSSGDNSREAVPGGSIGPSSEIPRSILTGLEYIEAALKPVAAHSVR